MANNTEEEHLDNPTNIQSENPPDEITSTTDTEDGTDFKTYCPNMLLIGTI